MSSNVNIFLDLDGVMADLEGHYLDKFGHKMDDADSRNQMWRNIDGHDGFWLGIPLVKGAKEFFSWLSFTCMDHGVELAILTAAPDRAEKHFPIARHKKQWVKQHLGDILVLPAYGSERKAAFLQNPGDVLIDDWGKNCAAWEEEGGVAIRHRGQDFASTREALADVLGLYDVEWKEEENA